MFVTNVLCAIFFLLLLRFYLHFKSIYRYWQDRGLKVIEPIWFPFGNFWEFITRDECLGHVLLDWYNKVDAEVIGLYTFGEPVLLIKDPDLIRDILVKDFNSFTDRGPYMNENDARTGQLWKLPGIKWKPLRTKMSTCFTIGKLKMMFSSFLNAGEEMEIALEKVAEKESIDVDDLSRKFTADIVAQSIFGMEVKSFREDNDFLRMVCYLSSTFNRKNSTKLALQIMAPEVLHFFSFMDIETVNPKAFSYIYSVVEKITEFREKTGTVGKDLMQLFIQLKNYGKVDDDTGEGLASGKEMCLTMDEVAAQAYTYFITGSETASATLTLLFYECCINQDIQKKVQEDIDQGLASTGGKMTYEAILEMKYVNMVVAETLRKYPALQYIVRKSVAAYKLDKIGLELKKGTRVYLSVHGLHRDPKYYPDPDKFDPERFSKVNQANRHPMTYIPFGEGPRNCIGKKMGYYMVLVGAIYVFRKFSLSVKDPEIPLKLHPHSYTIRPVNPLTFQVLRRSN